MEGEGGHYQIDRLAVNKRAQLKSVSKQQTSTRTNRERQKEINAGGCERGGREGGREGRKRRGGGGERDREADRQTETEGD